MINQFLHGEEIIETKLSLGPTGFEVSVGDNQFLIKEVAPGKYEVFHDGRRKSEIRRGATVCCVIIDKSADRRVGESADRRKGAQAFIDIDGILLDLLIPSDDGEFSSGGGGHAIEKDKIYAPMPGKIVKLLIKEGDRVTQKQPMVIVEAMKMENQVNSPSDGVVKKINFKGGEQVGTETAIIELELPKT